LASFDPWQERQEDRLTFTSFLESTERRRRERVTEERHRRNRIVFCPRLGDDGAGLSNAPPPASGGSGADATGEDSDDALF
jgi:hypothetical protein